MQTFRKLPMQSPTTSAIPIIAAILNPGKILGGCKNRQMRYNYKLI
jgi:hypothetical protein